MIAVAPVLVARIIGRWNSSARMREMFRCCTVAMVSPNQPILLDVGQHRGRRGGVGEAARQFLAEQVLVADIGRHALAADGERRRIDDAAREVAERDVHHAP